MSEHIVCPRDSSSAACTCLGESDVADSSDMLWKLCAHQNGENYVTCAEATGVVAGPCTVGVQHKTSPPSLSPAPTTQSWIFIFFLRVVPDCHASSTCPPRAPLPAGMHPLPTAHLLDNASVCHHRDRSATGKRRCRSSEVGTTALCPVWRAL
ncbi:hypothetical protein C0Q70_15290 [Pomacea canaliculata]|uniref:Uncharacterized protein n=1 Tax=Pomacea canaliculata TaxID=400727 RepID=A0A2T7NUH6_POMCA|nr:hypothetical protein C0Q70_15290 [Pomacea canaliculata]